MISRYFYKFIYVLLFLLTCFSKAYSEGFKFDITEIEILNNGNLFKGIKRGAIKADNGIIIIADKFIYNKLTNIIEAEGKVKIEDSINNNFIFSDKATYKRNDEIIFTEGNAKAVDNENREITANKLIYKKIPNIIEAEGKVKIEDSINNNFIFSDKATYKRNDEIIFTEGNAKAVDNENREITANKLIYKKIPNIIEAEGKVKIEDKLEGYEIFSEKIIYFKNNEEIITYGYTNANINSEYKIKSENVFLKLISKELSSKKKSSLQDDNQIYFFEEFVYYINENLIKGKNILSVTNFKLPNSDKFYFSDGIFNLKDKEFTAKETKINLHKNVFKRENNDPRIYAVSSKGDNNKTTLSKGIFTSCQVRDGCSPWSIKSEEIIHDKEKKQLSYKNAFLNIYDVPVFYFPKFFHPDPTVNRQSGLLMPSLNESNALGSSITQPYFWKISDNKDYTISPTLSDNGHFIIQNEYRQANENSNFLADFGYVNNYESNTSKQRNNLSHFFLNYDLDLNLNNYMVSNLYLSTEQVSNDTYLRVFDDHITKSNARPGDLSVMKSQAKLSLTHKDFNFDAGFLTYEDLDVANDSDRYQYVLPYYNFDTVLNETYFNGSINLSSSGSSNLKNTNNLKSNIVNNLTYNSKNYISNSGINNKFNLQLKNLNTLAKNDAEYKSSPQVEFISIFEANTSLPLIKKEQNYNNFLTPKLSLRINPSDMKNYSNSSNSIDVGNIFTLNRLGLGDSFESGRSLTIGLDYKKEKKEVDDLNDINKYFEIKLATVFRDKEEYFIPRSSTIGKKNSNIFGSVENNLHKNINLSYKFALDNDLNTFEYNDLSTTFLFDRFKTTFKFIEENGEMGNANILENSFSYNFDDKNNLTFKTRRNRKINLTEYYDLVYEYKIDCLTAGIKYKKSYYSDRDLKPTENLLFTLTIFPLTTYEHDAGDLLKDENSFLKNLETDSRMFK